MDKNTDISQNIFFYVPQYKIKSYRFGLTRGWVNDEPIFIFDELVFYVKVSLLC